MRVNDSNNLPNLPPTPAAETTAPHATAKTGKNDAGTIGVSSDSAELSSVAGRLSQILQTDSGRADRIRQLKEAVANGTYNVDSSAVSSAMIDESLSSSTTPKP